MPEFFDSPQIFSLDHKAKLKIDRVAVYKPGTNLNAINDDVDVSPYYPSAALCFNYYNQEKNTYWSPLQGYYQHVQFGFLNKVNNLLHEYKEDIADLFRAAFVIGADSELNYKYRTYVGHLPAIQQAKKDICDAAMQGDINVPLAYLKQTKDYPNLRRHARFHLDHNLGWMISLAYKEGRMQPFL